MSIERIATVWLPVTDKERSVAFYRDTLGLKVEEHDGNWTEVAAGDVTIGLNGNEDETPGDGGGVIAFTVSGSIDDEVAALKDRGAEFPGEISDHPWGRIATFTDPDGNELQLFQPPA